MGNITIHMQGLHDQFQKEIHTLYTKEDILNKVQEVEGQEGKSSFSSRWQELEMMCDAYGLSAMTVYKEKNQREHLLGAVPDRKRLKRLLLARLHTMYKEYPTATHFMERLVRRLAGEFAGDSVRLAILKRFVKYTDYKVGSLENGMLDSFSETERMKYETMTKAEQREFLISKLDDVMFDTILKNAETLDEQELAELLYRKIKETGVRMSEEDQVFLEQICNSKGELLEGWMERLLELENYLKCHLLCQEFEKKNGEKGNEYERYRQAKKDKISAKKEKAKLFRLADELASGKFYTNGKTRESLYLFALAFDMTACIDEEKDLYYEDRDFQKNLLFDYYNDNLLRYVMDEEYCKNSADYEAEPSGEGINYKNYVEVIYLYYINRRDLNLTPAERIKKAQRLINKCVSMAKKKEERMERPKPQITKAYKRDYIKEVLTLNKPKEIAEYICNHYYIIPRESESSRPKITIGSEQHNMRRIHRELVEILKDIYKDDQKNSMDKLLNDKGKKGDIAYDYDFGMDINFVLAECEKIKARKEEAEEEDKEFLELVEGFEPDFIRLMQKLGEKLRSRQKGLLKLNEKTGYTDKMALTRTELIAMCSFCFQYDMDDMAVYSVPELFEEFCQMVNPYLEECRFQKISVKNIFDMYVFYSLILGVIY